MQAKHRSQYTLARTTLTIQSVEGKALTSFSQLDFCYQSTGMEDNLLRATQEIQQLKAAQVENENKIKRQA